MGWEDRSGRQYYYRKKRIGKHVFSEYIGSGFLAELIANEDEKEREYRDRERKAWEREKARTKLVDDELDSLVGLIRNLIRANLLLDGYHPHRGQWRKKRDG